MAVYKPSNCRPFLNSVDLTQDVNVQCEINTSNQNITGYKLRLLNSLNDIIFEGNEYSFLSKLETPQSGINGSLLVVPLVVAEYPINFTSTAEGGQSSVYDPSLGPERKPGEYPRWKYVDMNNIYYTPEETGFGKWHYFKRNVSKSQMLGSSYTLQDGTTVAITEDNLEEEWGKFLLGAQYTIPGQSNPVPMIEVVENLSNGNANMPYKWEMTLAQSQLSNGQLTQEPVNPWAYDILVSTGQILGSNYERIQSNLSEEIYRDYYIQLLDSNKNPIDNRIRISSYDRTFGYIYPQEGFLTEATFNKATNFIIYKDTNDPEYVSAGRTVNYALTESVESGQWWREFAPSADDVDALSDDDLKFWGVYGEDGRLKSLYVQEGQLNYSYDSDGTVTAELDTSPTSSPDITVGMMAFRGNKYYYDMKITGIRQSDYARFNSRSLELQYLYPGAPLNGSQPVIFSSTRFLFMSQGDAPEEGATDEEKEQYSEYSSNPYKSTFNPLNGVWVLVGAADFKGTSSEETTLKQQKDAAQNAVTTATTNNNSAYNTATKEGATDEEKGAYATWTNSSGETVYGYQSTQTNKDDYTNTGDLTLMGGTLKDLENAKAAQEVADQNYRNRTGECYIRWQRPNDANTWANYIGRNWFVADSFVGAQINPGANYSPQINLSSNAVAQTTGSINVSPLSFFPEEAVVIYPKDNGVPTDAKGVPVMTNSDTVGAIFRNSADGSQVYLKPFIGLREGMRIKWSDTLGNAYWANIFNIDQNYWSVSLLNANTEDWSEITTPGTQYKITSFFKTSDENPFYAYSTPTLAIQLQNAQGILAPFGEVIEPSPVYPYTPLLNSRFLEVWGDYQQEQHVSWKRFRWILFDASVNNTQITENTYDGLIYYFFDGLQDDHRYELTLEVEDEQGIVQTTSVTFEVSLQGLGSGEAFPLEITFDCDTQSIDINFVRNGFVIPDYYNSAEYDSFEYEQQQGYNPYENGKYDLPEGEAPTGVEYTGDAINIPNEVTVQYSNTKALVVGSTPEEDTYVEAKLSAPLQENITINSQHTNINPYFVGELFEAEINLNDASNRERVKLGALLPPDTIPADTKVVPVGTVPNPQRNQILICYWSETRAEFETEWSFNGAILPSQPVLFYQPDGVNTSPYWRTGKPVVYSYQNPEEVENTFNRVAGGEFDYLPITYYNPTDTNQIKVNARDAQGNITDATYLEIDGVPITTFPTSATPNSLVYYYLGSNERSSSIAAIQFPLNQHSYGYQVVVSKGSTDSQNFKVLLSENDNAIPNDDSPRELYHVRELGDPDNIKTLTIWQDEKTYLAKQIDGSKTLMKAKRYVNAMAGNSIWEQNMWKDYRTIDGEAPSDEQELDDTANVWNDNCDMTPEYWFGQNVNGVLNHSGRQEINDESNAYNAKEITFNVALRSFDPSKVTFAEPAELQAFGWITRKAK